MDRQTGFGTYNPVPAPSSTMAKAERADYFRIFARNLLADEDYENLTREEWGSIFLLMLHQWTKRGTLPEDPKKLAGLARCSREELNDLMEKWPNLRPVEGQPGRVGIPFLVWEMATVRGFYAEQKEKSAKAVAARRGSTGNREPMDDPRVTHGEPVGLLNKDLGQGIKEGEGVDPTDSEPPLRTKKERPAPFSKEDIKLRMGDHYTTYLRIGGMFYLRFKPERDIKILLEILEETSAEQILEAASIHRQSAINRKNGDVKFMKEFDEWVSLGLHHTKMAPKIKGNPISLEP